MDRGFKGIWIPREIWLSKELTIQEKVLLAEIDSLDNDEGCFASNEYFGEFLDLSKERARKIIASLKNKGYISVEIIYKEGTKEVDKRIMKVIKGYGRIQPDGQNQPTGMGENDHYIEKSYNKKNNTNKEPRHKYGEYKNILLSDKDLERLHKDYGKPIIDEYITKMDEWIELNGKRYKNYNLALRKWLKNAGINPTKVEDNSSVNQFTNFIPDNVKNVVDDELERIKKLRG